MSLFRKQVLEKQGQDQFGDVIVSSPVGHVIMTLLLTMTIAFIIGVAFLANYSRKERVSGYLIPDRGLIKIQVPRKGVIEENYTHSGQLVVSGEKLFKIRTVNASASGDFLSDELLEQMKFEKEHLEKRIQMIPQEYEIERTSLLQKIQATDGEIIRLGRRIKLQDQLVKNEERVYERYLKLLDENAASSLEASNAENRLIQSTQALEILTNDREVKKAQILDLKAELRKLEILEQKQVNDLITEVSSLKQRIIQTAHQDSYIVSAPIAGQVTSLTARLGQAVNETKSLATILPEGGELVAELLIPSRAAGQIKKGQAIRLLYDAFPYQKFGSFEGEVASISKAVISPGDLPLQDQSEDSVFLVSVTIDNQTLEVDNQEFILQAGMTLSADIILEERKIIEWILAPLMKTAG